MYPVLIKIGPFTLYSYGALLVVAFYLSILLARIESKKVIDPQVVLDIALLVLFSGIVGGKLAYIIFHLPLYIKNPLDINLWRAGFIFHGGLFLSIVTTFLYTKKKNISFLYVADFLIPYVTLGQAIGRIGCFLNGCCYGKPTDLPWGMRFPLSSPAGYHYGALPLHPTQLYSSLFLFVLFLFLRYLKLHQKFEGETFLFYFLLYSPFRFFMDFLRGDNLGTTMFRYLSPLQGVSAGIFIVSTTLFVVRMKRSTKASTD
ncbi:MAG TPA: prolipoprotein diacylglyceryl transferase [Candidatus Omnitrophica bacterium]|nr:prolipoprotein diacylglyceryl transferase [Candidatus Omnitrophota bacterium]